MRRCTSVDVDVDVDVDIDTGIDIDIDIDIGQAEPVLERGEEKRRQTKGF